MTQVDLTIRGDIEVLRLKPSDVIVARLERRLDAKTANLLRKQIKKAFSGHKVVLMGGELQLATVREKKWVR